MTDQSAAPCLRRSACREGGNSPCGTGEHGERHADTERHHNHTHAPSSHHPGSHHLLTVEGLTVSFDRYAAACVETRDSRGEARAGNSGPSSRLSRIFSQRSRAKSFMVSRFPFTRGRWWRSWAQAVREKPCSPMRYWGSMSQIPRSRVTSGSMASK